VSFAGGLRGNSHLAITKPAFTPPGNPDATEIRIYGGTEDGNFVFTGFPNDRGFLGKIISEPFVASNRQDAEHKAYRAVLPSLSNWSINLDVPLDVVQRETEELSTGNIQTNILTSFLEAPFAVAPAVNLQADFRGLASLYREALISNSQIYTFLCFYKITEAVQARRKRMLRAAKRGGNPYQLPQEKLPSSDPEVVTWLNGIFPVRPDWDAAALQFAIPSEVRGMEMQDVIGTHLKPLRDNIAHALTTNAGDLTLSSDELLHSQQVSHLLPLIKCVVRRMLKNDFAAAFLTYLRDDGTFIV